MIIKCNLKKICEQRVGVFSQCSIIIRKNTLADRENSKSADIGIFYYTRITVKTLEKGLPGKL